MAETPEQKYNRIAEAVQQTILNNFPNPGRVGCPGDARVRAVAARNAIVEDDDWQHITHCSECYREFLDAKQELRRTSRRARTLGLIGGTALLILVAAAGYQYFGQQRPRGGTITMSYLQTTLNLRDISEVRGDAKAVHRETPSLPHRPLELTVILPFGSERGSYQFEFRDASDRVFVSGQATATIHTGNTEFTTHVDLSGAITGDYKFGWRQQPFNWNYSTVRLR